MTSIATLTMNPALEIAAESEPIAANRKIVCSAGEYRAGGGGIAVARAIVRLGGSARAIFPAGSVNGARLTALVAESGIEAHPIETTAETREVFHVTERASGSPYHFATAGRELSNRESNAVLETIGSLEPAPRHLVASGSLPPGVPDDFYHRVSELCAKRGIRLVVDTSGAPLRHAVGPGTFLLKPNLTEVRELLGGATGFSDFFLEGAVASIVATGRAEAVVVSMGAAGALLVTRTGTRRLPAPAVQVVSRFGAGDSMVAGMVLALDRGAELEDAVMAGIAAGTAAVLMPGTELCRRQDAERLLDEMRRRGQ